MLYNKGQKEYLKDDTKCNTEPLLLLYIWYIIVSFCPMYNIGFPYFYTVFLFLLQASRATAI